MTPGHDAHKLESREMIGSDLLLNYGDVP